MKMDQIPVYPKSSSIANFLFAIYVISWFLQIGERRDFFSSIRFEFFLGCILILLSLIAEFGRQVGRNDPSSGVTPWLIAFLVTLIIQIPLSVDSAYSWEVFVNRILKFSMMGFFIIAFVSSPSRLRLFCGVFISACLYITQESFRSALDGSMLWENQGVMRLHGVTSLFRHPNSLAGLAIGVIPFSWFLFPVVRSRWSKISLILLGISALGCVMYSGSRTAYLGLVVFALFLYLKAKPKIRFLFYFVIFLSVTIPFVPDDYKARFSTIFTGQEIEGASIDTRKQILIDAWEIFKRWPLGIGVSAFPIVREQLFGRVQDTHNLYFEVATNLGFQGFVAFFSFVFILLRRLNTLALSVTTQMASFVLKLKKKRPAHLDLELLQHWSDLSWIKAVSSATLSYLIIRLVLGFFGMDLYEIYWWIGLGLTVALFRIHTIALRRTHHYLSHLNDIEKGEQV